MKIKRKGLIACLVIISRKCGEIQHATLRVIVETEILMKTRLLIPHLLSIRYIFLH